VIDPYGEELASQVVDEKNGLYQASYTPADHGEHTIEVTLLRKPVAKSPYRVHVGENTDMASPFKTYIEGPGIQAGNKAGDPAKFKVPFFVFMILLASCAYPSFFPRSLPSAPMVAAAPLVVISSRSTSRIPTTASSPLISRTTAMVCSVPIPFVITSLNCFLPGTYSVSYTPTEPGVYHIDVIQRNPSKPLYYDHVKGSPVDVTIEAGTSAPNSIAYGPGLEPGNLDTFPANFTIEARDKQDRKMKEGGDPFQVEVMGPSGPVPATIKDNGDGTFFGFFAALFWLIFFL